LKKDVSFSGFKSQNPLIEKNQVGTRKIDTQNIQISFVEKNNVLVKSIPQIVSNEIFEQKSKLSLVIWTQAQFPQTTRSDLDEIIFQERQKDKQKIELASLISDIKKILG
jgi:hypothetical protein